MTVGVEPGRLSVADTRPGIATDDLPHVFERFYLYDRAARTVRSAADSAWRSCGSSPGRWAARWCRAEPRGRRSRFGYGRSFGVDDLEVGTVQRAERV